MSQADRIRHEMNKAEAQNKLPGIRRVYYGAVKKTAGNYGLFNECGSLLFELSALREFEHESIKLIIQARDVCSFDRDESYKKAGRLERTPDPTPAFADRKF